MGRNPRIQNSELHYHVIVRCNNRSFLFQTDNDFEAYLDVVRSVKKRHRFKLYNYELMHSHVHLFVQPSEVFSLSRTMHAINKEFALNYNKKRKRLGHFWIDRYKNIPVQEDRHALALMRYINRNAVRGGIVQKPGEWKYSGYRYYAFDEHSDLLDPHPSYLGLSDNTEERQRLFREFVCQSLPEGATKKSEFSETLYIGSKKFGRNIGLEEY
jgi:putative transposase